MQADRFEHRARAYFQRTAEHRERASQVLEEVDIDDNEKELMD